MMTNEEHPTPNQLPTELGVGSSLPAAAIEALTTEQVDAIVGPVHFQHDHHLCNCQEGALDGGDREAYASQQCRASYQWGVRARNLRIAALTAAAPLIAAQAKAEALAPIMALHVREDAEEFYNDINGNSCSTINYHCAACFDDIGFDHPWPCPTVATIEGETP